MSCDHDTHSAVLLDHLATADQWFLGHWCMLVAAAKRFCVALKVVVDSVNR
jgi:hypothetical protein